MAGVEAQETAFIAESNLHQDSKRPRVFSSSSRTGEFDVLAARGGFDPDVLRDEATEGSPLLGGRKGSSGSDGADNSHYAEISELPWHKRPSIYWVLFPFSILALAFGGIVAPRVNIIMNLICREYFNEQQLADPTLVTSPILLVGSNPQCSVPEVSSRSSMFILYGNLLGGILSAFVSPKLGALSDRYGRTSLIAITSLGSLAGDVTFIIAASRPDKFPVNWILVGYALDGLSGSFTTAMALVHAYATDCVPIQNRNVAFAYFHGVLFTGIAIGPIIAGLLTKATGTALTSFYLMLGVHIAFILFVGLVVPESLTKRRQQHAREKYQTAKSQRSSDWIESLREINLVAPLKILWPTGKDASAALRRNLVLLASIDTLIFGVAFGSMAVLLIYVRQAFQWETYESSVYLTVVNSVRVVGLFVVLPLITRFFRGKVDPADMHKPGSGKFDLMVIRFAVIFDTIGYLGYTLATTGPMMLVSGVVTSLGGMGSPTIQSALTKHVPPEQTGQLLGATGLLHALSRVVAPTIFNGIFAATAATFPQAVFVVLTATFGVACLCSWFVRPNITFKQITDTEEDEAELPVGQAA